MITRTLTKLLISSLKKGKVIALFGARRTGKTTLMNVIVESLNDDKILVLNGEDYDQQEIDLIEETDGRIAAYEIKWGDKEAKVPKAFVDNYPDAGFSAVNRTNFFKFLVV